MTITIKTKLHDGIYKSSGGGEVRIHHESSTGPRNPIKAIETFNEHCAEMVRSYGNIGCGQSWIEINGTVIHRFDLDEVARDDVDTYGHNAPESLIKSRTQKARELIYQVTAGTYRADKYSA